MATILSLSFSSHSINICKIALVFICGFHQQSTLLFYALCVQRESVSNNRWLFEIKSGIHVGMFVEHKVKEEPNEWEKNNYLLMWIAIHLMMIIMMFKIKIAIA